MDEIIYSSTYPSEGVVTTDGRIQVIPFYKPAGVPNYLLVLSGKQKQNKIHVELKDGGQQIEDLISILRRFADTIDPIQEGKYSS